MRAARPLQQVGHLSGIQALGRLVVHRDDDVARAQPRLPGRRTGERRRHHGLVSLRRHFHPHAGIAAFLVFADEGVFLGIEEVGVRVQGAHHTRQGAIVNGLVHVHFFRGVLFHHRQRPGEQAKFFGKARIIGGSRRCIPPRPEKARCKGAQQYNYRQCKQGSPLSGHEEVVLLQSITYLEI